MSSFWQWCGYPLLCTNLLAPSSALAQHAPEPGPPADAVTVDAEPNSPPVDMKNPRTGEEGTWIPRWVEKRHVLDEHRMQMCLKDVELADQDLEATQEKMDELELALDDLEHARDKEAVENYALTQQKIADDERLLRRERAVWVLVSATVVALGGGAIALFLK